MQVRIYDEDVRTTFRTTDIPLTTSAQANIVFACGRLVDLDEEVMEKYLEKSSPTFLS
jgi:hypothetical protein